MQRKLGVSTVLAVLIVAIAAAPASAMKKRGFSADCYSYTVSACDDSGNCVTSHCDQCDYYYNDDYIGSDSACY